MDTPGHSDFGGEVERVLSMVDGVALLVDATEGPMTQTRFVLSKALKQNLNPIVVVNKADRETARFNEVDSEVLDLFLTLDANDTQLEYKTVFASARDGWACMDIHSQLKGEKKKADMSDLFDLILKNVPSPSKDQNGMFSMSVTQLESDPYVGRCYLGRIESGSIKVGDSIKAIDESGNLISDGKVTRLFSRNGLDKLSVEEAYAGDIISIAGLEGASVNSTLCCPSVSSPIPSIPIDPPTVSVNFGVNDSPFQSEDGNKLTSNMIRDRLYKECETNVAMKVIESASKDSFEVRGRGELHLGILIENMRREGFELSISSPKVIMKKNGAELLEPMEEVTIDIPQEVSGTVIQKMNRRKGELKQMSETGDRVKLIFDIPSRGLLGYVSEFKNDTSGQGIINHIFTGYKPFSGDVDKSRKGSIISITTGTATASALSGFEARGTLFIKPGDKVYPGMIIGEHNKDNDIEVNPTKAKQVTNIRSTHREGLYKLTPIQQLSLEGTLSYIKDDELIEVTPKHIRIRKANKKK